MGTSSPATCSTPRREVQDFVVYRSQHHASTRLPCTQRARQPLGPILLLLSLETRPWTSPILLHHVSQLQCASACMFPHLPSVLYLLFLPLAQLQFANQVFSPAPASQLFFHCARDAPDWGAMQCWAWHGCRGGAMQGTCKAIHEATVHLRGLASHSGYSADPAKSSFPSLFLAISVRCSSLQHLSSHVLVFCTFR